MHAATTITFTEPSFGQQAAVGFPIARSFVKGGEGYSIVQVGEEFGWAWTEPGEQPDTDNRTYATVPEAIRAAAENWDDAGSGGSTAAVLRRAATITERAAGLS
ncbi:hypothetical protein [Agromyces humi]|uniref:hypothetical protein n=1 Tax=Agromyces humi TaxID=1766800 RepID=UPI00135858FD|nr:hypothetical protein [Agromyces humi]